MSTSKLLTKIILAIYVFGIVDISFSQSNFWKPINGPYGGTIVALITSTNEKVFAGTPEGGVFRSTNNGINWEVVNSGLEDPYVTSLAVNSTGYIFAGTRSSGVYRSTDTGDNWAQVFRHESSGIWTLAVNSQGDIFAGGRGLFRSVDNGQIWTQLNDGLPYPDEIWAVAVNYNGHVFVATIDKGVFRSNDNGDSWNSVNNGIRTNSPSYTFAFNKHGHVFVGLLGYGGVYRSTDDGDSWMAINTGLSDTSIYDLSIDNDDIIFAATMRNGVFRSTDNGDSWKSINNGLSTLNISALAVNSDGHVIAGTNGRGVFFSTDNGDSWSERNTGLAATNVEAIAVNSAGHIFAEAGSPFWLGTSTVLYSSSISRSTDNGAAWKPISRDLMDADIRSRFATALVVDSNDQIFVGIRASANTTGRGVYRSSDNGDNWTITLEEEVSSLAANASGQILAGIFDGVYYSKDNGSHWVRENSGLENAAQIVALAFAQDGYVFAGSDNGVFRSSDSGITWTQVSTNNMGSFTINENGHIFAGGRGIMRSFDNGNNWTPVNNGLTDSNGNIHSVLSLFTDSNGHIFAGAYEVFRSTDNGDSWHTFSTGMPRTTAASFAITSDGFILAGSTGSGIFTSVESTTPVNETEDKVPLSFSLSQNYPNPFNPRTTIEFSLPRPGFVTLKIYNVSGEEITALINQDLTVGQHKTEWNANWFSSGVYFIRLQVDQNFETKRLVLLR